MGFTSSTGRAGFDSLMLRLVLALLSVLLGVAAVALIVVAGRAGQPSNETLFARLEMLLPTVAAATLAGAFLAFWTPVAWRSSDAGTARLAMRLREAGISVQTTPINYEINSTPERLALLRHPALE